MYDIVWIEPNGIHDYYTFLYRPSGKLVKAQEAIEALDDSGKNDKISFAVCDVYRREKVEDKLELIKTADPAITLNGWNMTGAEITDDVYLQAKYLDGYWYIDVEAC
ncbi:hypothetical protein [Gimesia sp.]|uniref:hypothetical protein n=1 Tax=Gimesia sp. TaxID=2024833 RepID=UPI003A950827